MIHSFVSLLKNATGLTALRICDRGPVSVHESLSVVHYYTLDAVYILTYFKNKGVKAKGNKTL